MLARKLSCVVRLSSSELACLSDIQSHPVYFKRGADLAHEGDTAHKAFILQSGWACCYKDLPERGRQSASANKQPHTIQQVPTARCALIPNRLHLPEAARQSAAAMFRDV